MYLYIEMNQEAIVNSIASGEISISLLTELLSINKEFNIILLLLLLSYIIVILTRFNEDVLEEDTLYK